MFRVALVLAALLLPGYVFSDSGGAAPSAAAAKPRLQVSDLQPLVVVGTAFRVGESVRVTAIAGEGTGSKSGETGKTGRIGVRFPRLKLGRCSTYLISARGDKGSRATLRSVPGPCGIDR